MATCLRPSALTVVVAVVLCLRIMTMSRVALIRTTTCRRVATRMNTLRNDLLIKDAMLKCSVVVICMVILLRTLCVIVLRSVVTRSPLKRCWYCLPFLGRLISRKFISVDRLKLLTMRGPVFVNLRRLNRVKRILRKLTCARRRSTLLVRRLVDPIRRVSSRLLLMAGNRLRITCPADIAPNRVRFVRTW